VHASKIRRLGIPILTSHTIKEAFGNNEVKGAVIARVGQDNKVIPESERKLEIDTICIAVGLSPMAELAQSAGCQITHIAELGGWTPMHNERMETTINGIYVAGDVCGVEEASTAMEEGKISGIAAAESLGYLQRGKAKGLMKERQESPVFVPPYNILTLISEYADTNIQYIDGEAKTMPPLSGKQYIDLPEPFGKCEFVHTSHSETATMPYAKGFKDKGVREATWRLSLFPHIDRVMKSLVSVGFADKEPIKMNGVDIVPEKFLQLLIDRNVVKNKGKIPPLSSQEANGYKVYSLYFAIADGERNGEKIKTIAEILHRSDNKLSQTYKTFPKNVTSIGTSVVAQMLGKGEIPP